MNTVFSTKDSGQDCTNLVEDKSVWPTAIYVLAARNPYTGRASSYVTTDEAEASAWLRDNSCGNPGPQYAAMEVIQLHHAGNHLVTICGGSK